MVRHLGLLWRGTTKLAVSEWNPEKGRQWESASLHRTLRNITFEIVVCKWKARAMGGHFILKRLRWVHKNYVRHFYPVFEISVGLTLLKQIAREKKKKRKRDGAVACVLYFCQKVSPTWVQNSPYRKRFKAIKLPNMATKPCIHWTVIIMHG